MNILYLPWRDYSSMMIEGFRTREANILNELEKRQDVDVILCINQPIPNKIFNPIKKILKKSKIKSFDKHNDKYSIEYKSLYSKLKKVSNKLYILDISYFFPKGKKIENVSIIERVLYKEIRKALDFLKIEDYITWCFDLKRFSVSRKLKQDLLIFDAIDNLLEHDSYKKEKKFLEKKYIEVSENADLIFTVSEDLKYNMFKNQSNVHYFPNGINPNLYTEVLSEIPSDLPKNGKPIISYVGVMQERVDKELLINLINEKKEFNFVFIGPVLTPKYFKEFERYPNVYFLGAKKHNLIPSYLYWSDVCIIPHKINKFTKSMNPLKIYEYLAAGKEVVTTSVPPADVFSHIVHIANNSIEFGEMIEKALSKKYVAGRKEFLSSSMKEHTWENRVDGMLYIIYKNKNV